RTGCTVGDRAGAGDLTAAGRRGRTGAILMRRWMSAWRVAPIVAWVALSVAGGSCTYSPNFADGVVACGTDNSCPKGDSCTTDGTCSKHGGGSSSADAGGNGDVGGGDAVSKFVGTWTFQSGMLSGSCTDGSRLSQALTTADFLVIARGSTSSSVLLEYFC